MLIILLAAPAAGSEVTSLAQLRDALASSSASKAPLDLQIEGGSTLKLNGSHLDVSGFNLTLRGSPVAPATLDGEMRSRLFRLSAGAHVALVNINLINGIDSYGGAMWMMGSSTSLVNTTIRNCSATADGGALFAIGSSRVELDHAEISECKCVQEGGAMYLDSSSASFDRSTIANCSAGVDGGGMWLFDSAVAMAHSLVAQCHAGDDGGGVWMKASSVLDTERTHFLECHAEADGGGVLLNYFSTANLRRSAFLGCSAKRNGGAMQLEMSTANLVETTFERCSSELDGGALQLTSSEATLEATDIKGCSASRWGGACRVDTYSTMQLMDSTIANCTADEGGGLHVDASKVASAALTLERNRAASGAAAWVGEGSWLHATGVHVQHSCASNGAVGTCSTCDETMLDEVGTNYTGCQTMSKTGRTCQPWSSQTPHSHSANESMYPGFDLGDHNYCRNPDHPRFLGSAPWCYTTDPETRWEYCEPINLTPDSMTIIESSSTTATTFLRSMQVELLDCAPDTKLAAATMPGVTFPSCDALTFDDALTGRAEPMCAAVDTRCTDTLIGTETRLSTPVCTCEGSAYPRPQFQGGGDVGSEGGDGALEALPASLLPYFASQGCVRPVVAMAVNTGCLARDLETEVELTLHKTATRAGNTTIDVTVTVDGTDWVGDTAHTYTVDAPSQSWLSVNAEYVAGEITEGSMMVHVPVRVDASGLAENNPHSDMHHEGMIRVRVNADRADVLLIHVRLAVTADPAASQCAVHIAPGAPALSASVGTTVHYLFSARDIDGIPLKLPVAGMPFSVVATRDGGNPVETPMVISHSAGDNYSVGFTPALAGTYHAELRLLGRPTSGPNVTIVVSCPPGKAATDGGGCSCAEGFEPKSGGECQPCPRGFHKGEVADVTCAPCFRGSDCAGDGSPFTLEEIPLLEGHWRLSNRSRKTYRCQSGMCPSPDDEGAATRRQLERGSLRAGVQGQGCLVGHRGPKCAVCDEGWALGPTGLCDECTTEVRDRSIGVIIGVSVGILLIIAVVCLVLSLGLRKSRGKDAKERPCRDALLDLAGHGVTVLSAKSKILWSMLQMLSLLGICFGVDWPPNYEAVVADTKDVINLNFLRVVAVSCFQRWTWHETLLLRTLAPTALVVTLLLLSGLLHLCKAHALAAKGRNAVDSLIYLLYPSVTALIFAAFVPVAFDCGPGCSRQFLASDLSIDYDGDEHRQFQAFAGAMLVVWPLGVPAYLACMFFRNRKVLRQLAAEFSAFKSRNVLHYDRIKNARETAIRQEQEQIASPEASVSEAGSGPAGRRLKRKGTVSDRLQAMTMREEHERQLRLIFMTLPDHEWMRHHLKHYEVRCAYYDVIECLRKLFLTGIAVLMGKGTMIQLVLAVLLTCALITTNAILRPYHDPEDDMLSIVCQGAIVLNLAIAQLLHSLRAESEKARLLQEGEVGSQGALARIDDERAASEAAIGVVLMAVALLPIVFTAAVVVFQLLRPMLRRRRARRTFNRFDVDGDGEISASELGILCEALGMPLDDHQIREALERLDCDGNSLISRDEFTQFWVEQNARRGVDAFLEKPRSAKKVGKKAGKIAVRGARPVITEGNEISDFIGFA
jgi:hypothetical protein